MEAQAVLEELQALGTEQNRKIYRRHGAGEAVYGVSFADLDRLKKRIKVNQPLAEELWRSGVYDARNLAVKVADPARMDDDLLEAWVRDLDNYSSCDLFAGLAGRTALAWQKVETWTRSDDEWVGRTGWLTLANVATNDQTLPDDAFLPYLETIEREIHARKNYVRNAMNWALIAISLRSDALRERALAAAERIGKVHVDHGQTSCKTPEAAPYILKSWQRKEAKRA